MNQVPTALLILLGVGFAVITLYWHFARAREVLDAWARENRFEIVARDYRNFAKGPFFWTTSRGQAVYYVTVRDADGRTRRGWVRCGGFILGLFSNHAQVRWDQ